MRAVRALPGLVEGPELDVEVGVVEDLARLLGDGGLGIKWTRFEYCSVRDWSRLPDSALRIEGIAGTKGYV